MAVAKKKPVKGVIKFRVQGGKATPAPPVGSTLGANGVNMMDFINAFNDQTRELNELLSVKVTIFEDRTFSFTYKGETMANSLRKAAGIEKGSGVPNKTKVAKITREQVRTLAEKKMKDTNANDLAAAEKIVAGQARSMGIEVVD